MGAQAYRLLSLYEPDPAQHAEAERIAGRSAVCARGRDVIAATKPISAAYLDGFDFIPPGHENDGFITVQRDRYRELGYTLSNGRCHAEHLAEAKAVEHRANRRCIVIYDDTHQGPRGGWKGKGAKAVPYLLAHGFEVVEVEPPGKRSLGATVLRRG